MAERLRRLTKYKDDGREGQKEAIQYRSLDRRAFRYQEHPPFYHSPCFFNDLGVFFYCSEFLRGIG